MKLEINAEETKKILLEWAEGKFPQAFNEVTFSGYSSFRTAEFEWIEPEVPEPAPEAA